jgi:ABC-type transport system involved in multi-copper enzyme maturation permease subunit
LAAFSATGVLAREIENKTVLTVISKPVGRPVFIVGKFLGLAGALSVAFYLCGIVFLFTLRHRVLQTASDKFDMPVLIFGVGGLLLTLGVAGVCNFLYRMTFASTAVKLSIPIFTIAWVLVCLISPAWELQSIGHDFGDGQLLAATGLVFLAVLVLTAVAMAASTRFREVVTLVVCVAVLEVGLVSDYLFGRYSDQSWLADVIYRFVPNLAFFWVADALTAGNVVTVDYVLGVSSYAACYILAALLLAIALFQRREVG